MVAAGVEEPAQAAAVLHLGALARLVQAHVLSNIDVQPHPIEIQIWSQNARRRTSDPVLARPKYPPSGPSWHSRSSYARCPPLAGMQRRFAAPCSRWYSRQQRTKNVPPFVCGRAR